MSFAERSKSFVNTFQDFTREQQNEVLKQILLKCQVWKTYLGCNISDSLNVIRVVFPSQQRRYRGSKNDSKLSDEIETTLVRDYKLSFGDR